MKHLAALAAGLLLLFLSMEVNAQNQSEADRLWRACFPNPERDDPRVVNLCSNEPAREYYFALERQSRGARQVHLRGPWWPPVSEVRSSTGNSICYKQEIYERGRPPEVYSCYWYSWGSEQAGRRPEDAGPVVTYGRTVGRP